MGTPDLHQQEAQHIPLTDHITAVVAPHKPGSGQTHYLYRQDHAQRRRVGLLVDQSGLEAHVYTFDDKPGQPWLSVFNHGFSLCAQMSPAEALALGAALTAAGRAAEVAEPAANHLVGHA